MFFFSYFNPINVRLLRGVLCQNSRAYCVFSKEPYKPKTTRVDQQSILLPGSEKIRASILSNDPTDFVSSIPGAPEIKTVYDCLKHGLKISGDGPCIGTRRAGTQKYLWKSYSEVISRTQKIGSGLIELGFKPNNKSFIGIFAANREEYLLTLFSCAGFSMVLVPFYLSLGLPAVKHIINHGKLPVVISTNNQSTMLILNNVKHLPTLKTLITCEKPTEEQIKSAKTDNIQILTYSDVEVVGEKNRKEFVTPDPDELFCIPFTSGTSGVPKGVMLSHKNFISLVSAMVYGFGEAGTFGGTIISYLPPAHVYEICNEVASIYFARGIAFYSGAVTDLMTELRLLKPTIFPVVPKVMKVFFEEAMNKIKESKIKSTLLPIALWRKEKLLRKGKITKKTIWDKYIFKDFQEQIGGNIRSMTVTSSPVPNDIMRFFTLASGGYVFEIYGSSETLACAMTRPRDVTTGYVGGVLPCNHIKLTDVPEMGYFSKDNTGEICIKGDNVCKGYLNNLEATAESMRDGWYHSGDIGKWVQNGALEIIDRKKHLFKLSQGIYIAPEKVENVYGACKMVLQVLVDGMPDKDFTIAVVVPEPKSFGKWLASKGYTETEKLSDILSNKELRRDFLIELHKYGKEKHLNSLEQARNMTFISEPFTIENDMYTYTYKLKRNVARKRFGQIYKLMYEEGPLITSIKS